MAERVLCPRCKGWGRVRGRANPAAALVTFGLSFVLQKAQVGPCPACEGRGWLTGGGAPHRWTREEAAEVRGWAPLTAPPPIGSGVRREFSKPINALLGNSYRWGIADFEHLLQIAQWAIEQLYDAGFTLVGPPAPSPGSGEDAP